jgi:hypothetical protein
VDDEARLVPDLGLLDEPLLSWSQGDVLVVDPPGASLSVHALVCAAAGVPRRRVSRAGALEAVRSAPSSLVARPASGFLRCCAPGGAHDALFAALLRLAQVPWHLAPTRIEVQQDAWELLEELREDAHPESLEPSARLLDALQDQLNAAWAPVLDWARSSAAAEHLDLYCSALADLDSFWLLSHFGAVGGLAAGVSPDDPVLLDPTRLEETARRHGSPPEEVRAALGHFLERHRTRSRSAGEVLVSLKDFASSPITDSDALDVALRARWSPHPGVLVLPGSALPLAQGVGEHAWVRLAPEDTPAVLEVAASLLASGTLSAGEALSAARALEAP